MIRKARACSTFWLVLMLAVCPAARASEGRLTIPVITGRPGVQTFAGHPGWIDAYRRGKALGVSARIGVDGKFNLPDLSGPATLIVMFDGIETPPFVVPDWPATPGEFDVAVPVEYACVPPGYPEVWDKQYAARTHHFYQTFVPRCTQIYGCTIFDGPKVIWWGNKFNATLHEDGPAGKPIYLVNHDGQRTLDFLSGRHSDHQSPRVGWRHGDLEVVPGRTYALRVGGYDSHGGEHFDLPAFIRPDKDDGYAQGEAFREKTSTGGDLCCLIFGNGHGQLIENHIRTEEWEIFIPPLPPTRNWGQSFVNHGTSLAGLSFWGSNGSDKPVTCQVRLHKENPGGDMLRVVKSSEGHPSPSRPIIRYTDFPKQVPGCEPYYKLPADLFQVSYAPDELPLEPSKTYYVELVFSDPVMLYADGDYYDQGFAHYEDLKMERARFNNTKHSDRWTLTMNIVTYRGAAGRAVSSP